MAGFIEPSGCAAVVHRGLRRRASDADKVEGAWTAEVLAVVVVVAVLGYCFRTPNCEAFRQALIGRAAVPIIDA